MFKKGLIGATVSLATLFGVAAAAPVTFGTITTDVANYADRVALVSGSAELIEIDGLANGNANSTVGREGPNLDIVTCRGMACSFDVFFDGGIENQAGADLAIFGLGGDGTIAETFSLVINDITITGLELVQSNVIVGTNLRSQGYNIKQLLIDLDLFNVVISERITSIRVVIADGVNAEEFAAFASLNSSEYSEVPIPAAFLIFLSGAAGLFGTSRKQKRAS